MAEDGAHTKSRLGRRGEYPLYTRFDGLEVTNWRPIAFAKHPSERRLHNVLEDVNTVSVKQGDLWVPCRSEGFPSLANRIRCAWLVFTGRADALVWPAGQ